MKNWIKVESVSDGQICFPTSMDAPGVSTPPDVPLLVAVKVDKDIVGLGSCTHARQAFAFVLCFIPGPSSAAGKHFPVNSEHGRPRHSGWTVWYTILR